MSLDMEGLNIVMEKDEKDMIRYFYRIKVLEILELFGIEYTNKILEDMIDKEIKIDKGADGKMEEQTYNTPFTVFCTDGTERVVLGVFIECSSDGFEQILDEEENQVFRASKENVKYIIKGDMTK